MDGEDGVDVLDELGECVGRYVYTSDSPIQ